MLFVAYRALRKSFELYHDINKTFFDLNTELALNLVALGQDVQDGLFGFKR